jgi:glycosyltransferase involved in cell wall biosynthesis
MTVVSSGVPSAIFIDGTRLVAANLAKRPLTGIERVVFAYANRYATTARLLLAQGQDEALLSHADSKRLVNALHQNSQHRAAIVSRIKRKATFISWWAHHPKARDVQGKILLNVGHSGLDSPAYARRLRAQGVKLVTMVHDIIPLEHPEFCREGMAHVHERKLRFAGEHSEHIIVNSRQTGDALSAWAQSNSVALPPVTAIPLGVTEFSADAHADAETEPYFVVIGTIEPRKNLMLLLRLWRRLIASLGSAAPKLYVIGRRGWRCDAEKDLLDNDPTIKPYVIEVQNCEDHRLASLLRGARALLFPSKAEGFGIPLVEALSLGTPVIASALSVFKEIARDTPKYLTADDVDAWYAAVVEFCSPDSLERAAQLSRIQAFSAPTWDAHFASLETLLAEMGATGRRSVNA